MIQMKDVARRAYLLDHYGALLTDKQRDIYEWYYQQDMSLGEISEIANVSRNAVHDLLNRTDEKLERFERALGLIETDESRRASRDLLADKFNAWLDTCLDVLSAEAREALQELIVMISE